MKIYNNNMYMIKHIPSGLFKLSGQNNKWGKKGKIWKGSAIKNHLRLFSSYTSNLKSNIELIWNKKLSDCIIEMELFEVSNQNLDNFIEEELK